MKITPDQLVQNLSDSGLMSADEASSLCGSLSTVTGPTDADTVIKELASTGKLTAYQAESVCRGETSGLVFGDYLVLDKIGQGGMGVVLKAQHRRMNRVVAVKKLPTAALDSEDAVKRFYREVEAAARLMHTNIVTAFDASEHDGVHYLIMEYVDGQDLAAILQQRGPLPVDEAVGYVVQAAQGLEFAHKHGVIHRDIKPANLLLDAEGTVKILDMGLARIAADAGAGDAPEQLTTSGQVMGTCDYMAPEQAEDTHAVDHRADIYSLGCTLYRLLTGEPLYTGSTLMQVLLAHRESEVPSAREKRAEVSGPVDAVLQKMLAKEPADRYASMGEVAEALQAAIGQASTPSAPSEPDSGLVNFLEQIRHEPSGVIGGGRRVGKAAAAEATATAKRATTSEPAETIDYLAQADTDPNTVTHPSVPAAAPRPRRSASHRKQMQMLLWIGIGVVLSLLGIAVLATVIYIQTDYGTIAVNARDQDIEVLVKQDGNHVDVVDKRGQWRIKVRPGKYEVEIKGGHDRLTLDKNTVTVTRGGQERVTVTLKPSQLARRGPPSPWQMGPENHPLPGLVPRPAKIPGFHAWQVDTAEHRSGIINHAAWSPDGQFVAFGSGVTVRVMDAETLAARAVLLGHDRRVDSATWIGDEPHLATFGRGRDILLWGTDWSLRGTIPIQGVTRIKLSPDGSRFVAALGGKPQRLWWTDGRPGPKLGNKPSIGEAWSPDGQWIALHESDRGAVLYRPDGTRGPLLDEDGRIFAWHPDSQNLASAGDDGSISLWKTDGTAGPSWEAHADGLTKLAWSPDARWLASAGRDGKVRLWSSTGSPGPVLGTHDNSVGGVAWSPDSKYLASWAGGAGPNIRIWLIGEPPTEAAQAFLRQPKHVSWSPDSKRAACASTEEVIAFLHVDDEPMRRVDDCTMYVTRVAWSRDGRRLYSRYENPYKAAQVWSAAGQPIVSIEDLKELRWQPDNHCLAVREADKVQLLGENERTGTTYRVAKDIETWPVYGGVWNPQGTLAACRDGTNVRLSKPDGTEQALLAGHSADVTSVAWAPKGHWLAALTTNGEVRVWGVDGSLQSSFPTENDASQIAVHPNGQQVAVAVGEGTTRGLHFYRPDGQRVRAQNIVNLRSFAWNGDGSQYATCYENGLARWDALGAALPRVVATDRGQHSVSWSPTEPLMAVGSMDGSLRVWDMETKCVRWVGLRFNDRSVVTFSPAGEILHGDPAELKDKLIYIVQREPNGPQELLTYQQFHDHLKKVGFPPPAAAVGQSSVADPPRRDPPTSTTEGVPEDASTTPSETDSSNVSAVDAASYRPPVIEPELVKSFAVADLYQFLAGVVNDKPSDFMLRLLYTEIAVTMQREQVGSWRIGAGMSRDGSAYEFSVRNTRWFARKFAPDEAAELGLSGRSWGRTLNVMWSDPVNKIMNLESADVRIETDAAGNRALVGRIRCNVDAPRRADYLALVFETPSPEEGENVTRNSYQYVRPERLPVNEFEVHIPLDKDEPIPEAGRFYFRAFLFEPEASFYRISNELVWIGPQ